MTRHERALEKLHNGTVIPANPLALDENRQFDEKRERALLRYYLDAGVGGLAVAVHTTQFEIRDPKINLLETVLKVASEEVERYESTHDDVIVKIAGVCGPVDQALKEAELAKKYGVMILEDNPYGDVRVSGESVPAIKSLDTDGLVIYSGSFSKIVAPGIRVGYALAPKEIIAKLTVAKQTQDVHTPLMSQLVVYKWLTEYDFEAHINKIREIYRRKLNLLCDCVDKELSDFLTYNRPEGGLFVWAKLNDGIDMLDFCRKASAAGVSVVPGNAFMVDGDKECSYIRMNFSTPSDEAIVKGVKILGEVAKTY